MEIKTRGKKVMKRRVWCFKKAKAKERKFSYREMLFDTIFCLFIFFPTIKRSHIDIWKLTGKRWNGSAQSFSKIDVSAWKRFALISTWKNSKEFCFVCALMAKMIEHYFNFLTFRWFLYKLHVIHWWFSGNCIW